jgi:hypothetical protein
MAFPNSGLFVPTDVARSTGSIVLNLDLETHRCALYTDSITGADLTTDTAYGVGAWASNEVANGNGYTTGGELLIATTYAHTAGGVVKFDANDTQWVSATFTARGVLIYADALAGNNGIAALNFGSNVPVSNGTFAIQWASGGIFTIDLVP